MTTTSLADYLVRMGIDQYDDYNSEIEDLLFGITGMRYPREEVEDVADWVETASDIGYLYASEWVYSTYGCDIDESTEINFNKMVCDIKNKAPFFMHRRYFKQNVFKDLITEAMHPNRIQKQINQFDDIETYFEAIGC